MAKTRECCGALSLRKTGDDLHVSLHKGFKIRLAGIVPVFIEFTGIVQYSPSPSLDRRTAGSRNEIRELNCIEATVTRGQITKYTISAYSSLLCVACMDKKGSARR